MSRASALDNSTPRPCLELIYSSIRIRTLRSFQKHPKLHLVPLGVGGVENRPLSAFPDTTYPSARAVRARPVVTKLRACQVLLTLKQPNLSLVDKGRPKNVPSAEVSNRAKAFMEDLHNGVSEAAAQVRQVLAGSAGKNHGGAGTKKTCRSCKEAGRGVFYHRSNACPYIDGEVPPPVGVSAVRTRGCSGMTAWASDRQPYSLNSDGLVILCGAAVGLALKLKEHASRLRPSNMEPLSTQPDGLRRIVYLQHGHSNRHVIGDAFMNFAQDILRRVLGRGGPVAAPSTVVTFPGAKPQKPHADLRRVGTYSLIVAHHNRSIGFRHLPEPVLLRAGDALLFLAPLCHFGTALQEDASRVSMSHLFLGPGILLYDMRPSAIYVHGCGHDDDDDGDTNDVLITWHPVFKQSGALDVHSPVDDLLADGRGATHANGGSGAALELGSDDNATLELADGGCTSAMLLADGNGASATLASDDGTSASIANGGDANGTLTRASRRKPQPPAALPTSSIGARSRGVCKSSSTQVHSRDVRRSKLLTRIR